MIIGIDGELPYLLDDRRWFDWIQSRISCNEVGSWVLNYTRTNYRRTVERSAGLEYVFPYTIQGKLQRCERCDCTVGVLIYNLARGNKIFCALCWKFAYQANKREVSRPCGPPIRTAQEIIELIKNRPTDIPTSTDFEWCLICGTREEPFDFGHLLSRRDAMDLGHPYSCQDDYCAFPVEKESKFDLIFYGIKRTYTVWEYPPGCNLVNRGINCLPMCPPCNVGLGRISIPSELIENLWPPETDTAWLIEVLDNLDFWGRIKKKAALTGGWGEIKRVGELIERLADDTDDLGDLSDDPRPGRDDRSLLLPPGWL